MHLLSGATMLGAFFILTDPVTASTTNRGRLIFGALAGLLVWLIRSFGGYPDGVAFAVLLANITVPLIDYYASARVWPPLRVVMLKACVNTASRWRSLPLALPD